jgi:hypothetical protein
VFRKKIAPTREGSALWISSAGRTLGELSILPPREQNRILRDYYTKGMTPEWIAAFDRQLRGGDDD